MGLSVALWTAGWVKRQRSGGHGSGRAVPLVDRLTG